MKSFFCLFCKALKLTGILRWSLRTRLVTGESFINAMTVPRQGYKNIGIVQRAKRERVLE